MFDEHHNSINPEEISWIMQKLSDDYIYNIYSLDIFLIYSMVVLGITAMNWGITDISLGITLKYLS